jgi:hypothetical protein
VTGRIDTLPRVRALDPLRGWTRKVRANPWLAVGVAIGTLIVCVWIGWAIHVTSDHGAREGLGVLIAWPAILAALALISVPLTLAFRVIRASITGSDAPESDGDETEDFTHAS